MCFKCDKKTACVWFSGVFGAMAILMGIQLLFVADAFNVLSFLVLAAISVALCYCTQISKPKKKRK